MKRRQFIALLGGAAAAPLATRAQQPTRVRQVGIVINRAENDAEAQTHLAAFRQRRVGILTNGAENAGEGQTHLAASRERFREPGWIEGRNMQLGARWPFGAADRSRAIAGELGRLKPDVIVVSGGPALSARMAQ